MWQYRKMIKKSRSPAGTQPQMSRTLHLEPGTSAFIPRNLLVFKINYVGYTYQNDTSSVRRLSRDFCGWNRWRPRENFYEHFELANLWITKECQLRSCAAENPIVKLHSRPCKARCSSEFWFSVYCKLEQNYQNVVQATERHEVRSQIWEKDLVKGN